MRAGQLDSTKTLLIIISFNNQLSRWPLNIVISQYMDGFYRVGRPYEFDYLLEIPNDNLILDQQRDRENNFFDAALRVSYVTFTFFNCFHINLLQW